MPNLTIGANTTIADLRQLAGSDGANLKGREVNGKTVLYTSKKGVGLMAKLFGGRALKRAHHKQELGREALGQALKNRFGSEVAGKVMNGIDRDFDGKRYLDAAMIDKAVDIGEQIEAEVQEDLENRLAKLALPDPPGFGQVRHRIAKRHRDPKVARSHGSGRDRDIVKTLATVRKEAHTARRAMKATAHQPSRSNVSNQTRIHNRKQFKKLHDMMDFAMKHPERAKSAKADYAFIVNEAIRRIEVDGGKVDPEKMPEKSTRSEGFTAHGRSEIRRAVLGEFKQLETKVPDDLWARREVAIEAIKAHLLQAPAT